MGRDVKAGKGFFDLYLKNSALFKGLDASVAKLRTTGSAVAKIGTQLTALGAIGGAGFLPAIRAASDMQETMNKFDVVFGGNRAVVKAWSDDFAGRVGRSKKQIADFLASSQDLFVPIGFDADTATQLSKTITGLAVDLASFNNTSDDDALRDLQAALTGSGEVMKKYGVIVNETAVKQELLAQGFSSQAIKNATEQQKAFARLQIILKGTQAAQGDATRSSGSFANQMKALRAEVSNTAVAIGGPLLDAVTPLVGHATRIVGGLAKWAENNRELIVTIAKVAAGVTAVGFVLIGIGGLLLASGAAISAFTTIAGIAAGVVAGLFSTIAAAVGLVLSPIGLAVAAIIGLASSFRGMRSSASAGFAGLAELAGNALSGVSTLFSALVSDVSASLGAMGKALAAGDVALAAQILWTTVKLQFQTGIGAINEIWQGWKTFFLDVFNSAVFGTLNTWTRVAAFFQSVWTKTITGITAGWYLFRDAVVNTWQKAVEFIAGTILKIQALFDDSIDVDAQLATLRETFQDGKDQRAKDLENRLTKIANDENAALKRIEDIKKRDLENSKQAQEARSQEIGQQAQANIDATKDSLDKVREEFNQLVASATGTDSVGGAVNEALVSLNKTLADNKKPDGELSKARLAAGGSTFSGQFASQIFGATDDKIIKEQLREAKEHTKKLDKIASVLQVAPLVYFA